MKCHKPDGCGVYDGWNCADCPASRPEYAEQAEPATPDNLVAVIYCEDCVHWYPAESVCLKIYDDGHASAYAWQQRKAKDFCNYGERRGKSG